MSASGGVAGAILAGGSARRLGGVPKGLEVIAGSRIVDRVAQALRAVTAEIVLVGAAPTVASAVPELRVVADEMPGAGPLGGIISALRATGRDTVVVAWDMPFVRACDLELLLDRRDEADVSLPDSDGQLEPLCALYRARVLPVLARAFDRGERSALAALSLLRVHRVVRTADDARDSFASINTPEQLEAARSRDQRHLTQRETC